MLSVIRFGLTKRAIVAAFLLGLAIQVGTLGLRGTSDVQTFEDWAVGSLETGVFGVYALPLPTADPELFDGPPDYPPLSVTTLWVMGHIAQALHPGGDPYDGLIVIMKVGLLGVAMGVVLLVLATVVRATGNPTLAWATALALWLNPALLLNGAILGYLDPMCWALGLAALVWAGRGQHKTAGLLLGLAILAKHQGLFFALPVLAVTARDSGARRQLIAVSALTVISGMAPFLVFGSSQDLLVALKVNFVETVISGYALNFWWLVTEFLHVAVRGVDVIYERLVYLHVSPLIPVLGFNPKWVTHAVVVGAALWMYSRVHKSPSLASAAAMGALSIHVYFVFAISVHENHLVNAIPLAAVAAVFQPRYWRIFWGLTAIAALNQYLFYGFGENFESPDRTGWFWIWTAGISLANMALLGVHGWHFQTHGAAVSTSGLSRHRL